MLSRGSKLSFLIFLSISCSMALYEFQAGVFDWSIRNIGEIDTLHFAENSVYFTVKDNDKSIGSLSYQTGKIGYIHVFIYF